MFFGSLTLEQKEYRQKKVTKFFNYIHFDWGDETPGKNADWKTGEKQWQIYKEVHGWTDVSEDERQGMKRKFYCENIDKEFAQTVETKNQEEMKEFQSYCQYFNSLSSVGYQPPGHVTSVFTETKQYMYLFYLMLYPMNVPYSWSLFLIAAMISFLQRNQFIDKNFKPIGTNVLHSFLEEECMNLFLMVFLVPSGYLMRLVIHACLSIWALIHVCDMFQRTLEANPNALGISALKPIINYVYVSKFELLVVKNIIEVFIGIASPFGVFFGQVAMIFPILYFQYIRIKYISSLYMKYSFENLDKHLIQKYLPTFLVNSQVFVWMKNKLITFVDFEKNNTKKSAEQTGDQSFRGDDSAEKEYIKSFQQGAQGSQNKTQARNGQASQRVPVGEAGTNKMGKEQQDNSQRVFAAMMSDKNFKANFNFNMDGFKKDDAPGPTVEEVGDDDLD